MPEQRIHILVPVDFSVHSERALAFATAIAKCGGVLELLHVVEDPFVTGAWGANAFTPNMPELKDDMIADARSRLDVLKKAAAANDRIVVAATVVTGEPARAIVEHAKTGAFDLIVMSTHGRTGLTHLFLGSVAERVLRTAPCPVLTVRAGTSPAQSERAEATTVAS
jgi:nucleotide-binding universal stress UspA family protein